ncbi:DUF6318 family protein [Isoptericola halotolerans]|uniref:DUF6318 family protein n=1 Tax=Isoptericola halotolerans TaxID=300560 RepID=UPI003890A653
MKEAVKEPSMPPAAPALGALALVALLLTGCTQPAPAPTGPGTTAEATSSPSPSVTESSPAPSPTPVVVAPERPAAMNDDGHEGAEAAAKYFQLLDPYMMKTGDTAEWEAMSHKECSTCSNRLEQARTIAENGDVFEGGETTVRVLHTYEQDEPTGGWPLDVEVNTAAVTITAPDGTVAAEFDEDQGRVRMELAHRNGQWYILGIAPLKEE